MTLVFIALFVFGSMASLAWYGAQPPKYSRGQKRAFGLLTLSLLAGIADPGQYRLMRIECPEPSGLADAATADGWPGPDTVAKIYSNPAAKK
jgi:hypothetical protein